MISVFLALLSFTITESWGQAPPQPEPASNQPPEAVTLQNLPDFLKGTSTSKSFTTESAEAVLSVLTSPYNYEQKGRRDPFVQPEILRPPDALPSHGPFLPLQDFSLEQVQVKGIVWSVRKPKALLEAGGRLYTVTLGDKVGNRNGYVALIREGEIVVVETVNTNSREVSSTRVLQLKK